MAGEHPDLVPTPPRPAARLYDNASGRRYTRVTVDGNDEGGREPGRQGVLRVLRRALSRGDDRGRRRAPAEGRAGPIASSRRGHLRQGPGRARVPRSSRSGELPDASHAAQDEPRPGLGAMQLGRSARPDRREAPRGAGILLDVERDLRRLASKPGACRRHERRGSAVVQATRIRALRRRGHVEGSRPPASAAKQKLRERIWTLLERRRVARFPFPATGRIPNFQGAEQAAARGARVGKGGGYSDLEFALARAAGALDARTTVLTTVHALQILKDDIPMTPHDVPVDLVVTPERVIRTQTAFAKPSGIRWRELSADQLEAMPVLRRLQVRRTAERAR